MSISNLKDKLNAEPNYFVRGPQAMTVKDLLQVPSEFRTFSHCKEIINHVKEVKFLEKYMESEQIYDLAKEFRLQSFKTNDIIFRQGDDADAFYIILSGSVKIYVDTPSDIKHFNNLKEIMELRRGEAFGELALIYDSVRSATIIAGEPSDMIVLDKEGFRKHIRTVQTSHITHIMDFYQNFLPFHGLNTSQVATFAGKSLLHKFPSNTVIIREAEMPNDIYFLKSGRVKIIRRMKFRVLPHTRVLDLEDYTEPSLEDINLGNYRSLLVQIDELSNGDSFGDYSILHNEPMNYTVISAIPCELITLPANELTEGLPQNIINEYKSICKPYADDDELRKVYLDMIKWEKWKKNLISNLATEKMIKKGFNTQMRKPVLKLKPLDKISVPLKNDLIDALETAKPSSDVKNMQKQLELSPLYGELSPTTSSTYRLKKITSKRSIQVDTNALSTEGYSNPKLPLSQRFKTALSSEVISQATPRNVASVRNISFHDNLPKFKFVHPQHKVSKKPAKTNENDDKSERIEEITAEITEIQPVIEKEPESQHSKKISISNLYSDSPKILSPKFSLDSTNMAEVLNTNKALEKVFRDMGIHSIKLPPLITPKLD